MSSGIGNTALAYARLWHVVDARGQVLGRLSSRIATTLMGKHKPIHNPAADCGDYVVVINARDVRVSGKKADQKVYYRHSGYPGGLKEIPYSRIMERNPSEIIQRAVRGMLPKNRLRTPRMDRLHIFADSEHPYQANATKIYDQKVPLPCSPIE
ncbi:54S ribosomal protein L23, mitochondrial [Tieghemiomyces parasiticus]|uniref:54S ribosomal protein L23, mitochondrial n=1 Tax=Tieghemiomyces parasiticus TaxID=78921 RepID=A0A9W8DSI3_9FUNG|nr:54S ribosomal protein L23, mitochondrial [Tieghemiomyces parasiticus]KAJ1917715.1 54S ribosomal protein L23, mitochondrial [Tieghemiomyces parasiticus]